MHNKSRQRYCKGFSMPTISSFRSLKNKHDVYRDKDFMKKFCESLRKHAMKIVILKRKKIIKKRAAGII